MKTSEVLPKEVARVWSDQIFRPTPEELETYGIDETYGVPFIYQQEIKKALEQILAQMGVPTDSVLFSGYSADTAHQIDATDAAVDSLRSLTNEVLRLQEEGAFELDPELKDKYQRRLAQLKETKDKKTYFFNDFDGLDGLPEQSDNPIHYAGMGDSAVIGVYDKAKLAELSSRHYDVVHTVTVDPGIIDEAKILEFYPRFEI